MSNYYLDPWEPYQVSIPDGAGGWLHFDLERTPFLSPDSVQRMRTEVYYDGHLQFTLMSDMPKDEHDTAEVLDILNDEYKLGLY